MNADIYKMVCGKFNNIIHISVAVCVCIYHLLRKAMIEAEHVENLWIDRCYRGALTTKAW